MLSGVSIICFTSSYVVALALELSRLFFRSGLRGALLIAFALLGLVTQSVYLVNQAAAGEPLSSWYDWYMLAAALVAATYLLLVISHPRVATGLFLLPVVLGLIAVAHFRADRTPFPQREAWQIWTRIHGYSLLLGTVVVVIGFAAGLMYLIQAYRLKHKLPPEGRLRLPSLEWLERINARSIVVSVILLGLGVLSGIVINADGGAVDWNDPAVWSSGVLFGWLASVSVFEAIYKPARGGRKVAYLTLGSFVFLVAMFAAMLLAPGGHGGGRSSRRAGCHGRLASAQSNATQSNARKRCLRPLSLSMRQSGGAVTDGWMQSGAPTRAARGGR